MSASLAWPICALMALLGVMTVALLGCSLRRMRSRDRLTVLVWWFASVCSVGAGLWGSWALGLSALTTPVSSQALAFQPMALAALAVAAATVVAALHLVARLDWPEVLRCAVHTTLFTAGWVAMFEIARRGFSWGPATPGIVFGLPTLALSATLVAVGCATALWLVFGERWRHAGHVIKRLWLCAATLGGCHAAALVLSLRALQLPPAPETLAGHAALGANALELVSGLAAVLVAVGLFASWLDTHAHMRNRELASSLNDANKRLRDQAHSDPLTRMPNRLLFEERMNAALAAIGPDPEPAALAVLFIDLDGFKPVNDSYGHAAGDQVLRQVSVRLSELIRDTDTVARIGGDEFLILLEDAEGAADAVTLADRILHSLSAPMQLMDREISLSCSIGIALFPDHAARDRLISSADAAMYVAKHNGGNTYTVYEQHMQPGGTGQMDLQQALRGAIGRNELQLHYQPKMDGRSGNLTGVEALLRWQSGSLGAVLPDVFIPLAERFGLIVAIGDWVIEDVCRQLASWTREGIQMHVAINLSGYQLRQPDFVARMRHLFERYLVDPRQVICEVTESVAMEDTASTQRVLRQLSELGVSLSIDDFGTGYSSLAYLRQLRVQQLKIDRSFIRDLDSSIDARAVVDAVIRLAHSLGLRVVAEGVETVEQYTALVELGCDELQGFYFAEPMTAEALRESGLLTSLVSS